MPNDEGMTRAPSFPQPTAEAESGERKTHVQVAAPLRAWVEFVSSMRGKYGARKAWLSDEYVRFTDFACGLPEHELPLLLFHAYERYRVLDPKLGSNHNFHRAS